MKCVISVGGSLLVPKDKNVDVNYIKKFTAFAKNIKDHWIVCGGGATARTYAKAAKNLGINDDDRDLLGIMCTHVNAMLLTLYSGLNGVGYTLDDVETMRVFGGLKTGQTTDASAAEIAKTVQADYIVNLTDVDGVYDKNPKEHDNAKMFRKIGWKEFFEVAERSGFGKHDPGMEFVFEPRAAKICEKAGLKVVVINGHKLDELQKFMEGKDFLGTIIG